MFKMKVNKKSGELDRFTISPELWEDPKDSENFPFIISSSSYTHYRINEY